MKKNGFTLVEILAVLVLVSVIAIISVPSVINYINSSKNEISEVTEKLIFTGVDLYLGNNRNRYNDSFVKQYCITLNDVVEAGFLEAPIIDSVSSKEVDLNQYVKIKLVYNTDLKVYKYEYELSDECNVEKFICVAATEKNKTDVGFIPVFGQYNYGDEYICELGNGEDRHFFVLEDGDDTNLKAGDSGLARSGEISLIMDSNIDGTTNWNSSGDGKLEPTTAKNYLNSQTSSWLISESISIELPTGGQIAQAGEVSNWDPGNESQTQVLTYWLNNGLSENLPYCYWTSTIHKTKGDFPWFLYYDGSLTYSEYQLIDSDYCGLRPVITIPKDSIKN